MNITADNNIPYVQEAFNHLGTVQIKDGRKLTQQDLLQTDILLVRSVTKVNKALLQDTPIKFVASATAGFNHIDLNYLATQNIGFARAPGSNAISAAEYVFAGICLWSLNESKKLSDQSIGIIGYGNVGSRVKQLCDSAGLKCVINDPPLAKKTGKTEKNQIFSSIEEALSCDIVTLHTPLSVKGDFPTFQLINKKRINTLNPETLFINASRGEVVEESALLSRMKIQNDLTLILDVWENEPKISLEMLKHTLIGTPHIAGYSIDGKIRGTEMIYNAACDFLGKEPLWSANHIDIKDNPKPKIEVKQANNQQGQILSAYNINSDNKDLKKILSDLSLSNGNYFDQLRKNYPPRREFSTLK